jgi:hypothetical protein
MRSTPARLLLSVISLGALASGVLTSQLIFFVVALGAAILLGTSLSTHRRPLTHSLEALQNHAVEVRLWGSAPPDLPGATLVLTSVNALGAGVHLFFKVQGGGSMHLKVAQPKVSSLASDRIVIGSARYVQWNGKRLPREGSDPAVVITLSEVAVKGGSGSVA